MSWTPDGKLIYSTIATGNADIWIVNADGTGETRLTNNLAFDEDPGWSPDGTKIAFDTDRDGNFETYAMNADGTNQTRLTNDPAADERPDWKPVP